MKCNIIHTRVATYIRTKKTLYYRTPQCACMLNGVNNCTDLQRDKQMNKKVLGVGSSFYQPSFTTCDP